MLSSWQFTTKLETWVRPGMALGLLEKVYSNQGKQKRKDLVELLAGS
jgi:hypothetical protein